MRKLDISSICGFYLLGIFVPLICAIGDFPLFLYNSCVGADQHYPVRETGGFVPSVTERCPASLKGHPKVITSSGLIITEGFTTGSV